MSRLWILGLAAVAVVLIGCGRTPSWLAQQTCAPHRVEQVGERRLAVRDGVPWSARIVVCGDGSTWRVIEK